MTSHAVLYDTPESRPLMFELISGCTKFLSFSADGDENDELLPGGKEDVVLGLFAEARNEMDEKEEGDEDEGDDAEPEDDFDVAWEALDLARALYEKQQDESALVKLKLSDTFIALGDVSLETEKFD